MYGLILGIHLFLAVALVGIILLQGPKGEGLGAIGGSARLFHGPKPRETFFTRITAVLSVLFAVTSIYLTFLR